MGAPMKKDLADLEKRVKTAEEELRKAIEEYENK